MGIIPKRFYTDGAREFIRAAKELKWHMPTSTPGDHKKNGVAERWVRKAKERGRANLSQSGFTPTWWPWAVRHGTGSHNLQPVDGKSPYKNRHGEHTDA